MPYEPPGNFLDTPFDVDDYLEKLRQDEADRVAFERARNNPGSTGIDYGTAGLLAAPREPVAPEGPPLSVGKVEPWGGGAELLKDSFKNRQRDRGMLPASVDAVSEGSPLPGATGDFFRQDSPRFENQYSRRIERWIDDDTALVSDSEGNVYNWRHSDINAAELGTPDQLANQRQGRSMRDSMPPGTHFTMEQPRDATVGEHGRSLGVGYGRNAQGQTFDMSRPENLSDTPNAAYGTMIPDIAVDTRAGRDTSKYGDDYQIQPRAIDEMGKDPTRQAGLAQTAQNIGTMAKMGWGGATREVGDTALFLTAKDPLEDGWGFTNAVRDIWLSEPEWAKRLSAYGQRHVDEGFQNIEGGEGWHVAGALAEFGGGMADVVATGGLGAAKLVPKASKIMRGTKAASMITGSAKFKNAMRVIDKMKLTKVEKVAAKAESVAGDFKALDGLPDSVAARELFKTDSKAYVRYAEELKKAKARLGDPLDESDASKLLEDAHEIAHNRLGLQWTGEVRAGKRLSARRIATADEMKEVGLTFTGKLKGLGHIVEDQLFNKHQAIENLGFGEILTNYVQATRAADYMGKMNVLEKVQILDEATGTYENVAVGVHKILGGLKIQKADGHVADAAEILDDMNRFLDADSTLFDFIPRQEKAFDEAADFYKKNPLPGGTSLDDAILKRAREESGLSEMGVPDALLKEAQEDILRGVIAEYGEAGMARFGGRVQAMREWMWQVGPRQFHELGGIDADGMQKLRDTGQHYSPSTKLVEDAMGGLGGEALRILEDVQKIEDGITFRLRTGLASSTKKGALPIQRKTQGATMDDKIMMPIQAAMLRGAAYTKYVAQQRVRNQVYREFTKAENAAEAAAMGFRVVPDTIKSGKRIPLGTSVHDALIDGKRIRYTFDNKRLSRAMDTLEPGHQSLINRVMEHSILKAGALPTRMFRVSVTRGIEFALRNPFRDMFQSAVFSKFGYIPVVNFVSSAYSYVKSDRYRQMAESSTGIMAGSRAMDVKRTANMSEDAIAPATKAGSILIDDATRGFGRGDIVPKGMRSDDPVDTVGNIMDFYDPKEMALFAEIEAKQIARELADPPKSRPTKRVSNWFTSIAAEEAGGLAGKGGMPAQAFWGFFGVVGRGTEILENIGRIAEFKKGMTRAEGKGLVNRIIRNAFNQESRVGTGYSLVRSVDYGLAARQKRFGGAGLFRRQQQGKGFREGFKQAYNTPKSQLQLGGDSREITLDFLRTGHVAEAINAYVPFATAELQDLSKFTRSMREAPLTTMYQGFKAMTLPAVANWYIHFDDKEYNNISPTSRALKIHTPKVNDEIGYIGIPWPAGMVTGAFALAPVAVLDQLLWEDPEGLQKTIESFFPDQIHENFQERVQKARHEKYRVGDPNAMKNLAKALENFSVTRVFDPRQIRLVTPFFELMGNEDFLRGNKIYSERHKMGGEWQVEAEERSNAQTRLLDDQIASMLREVNPTLFGEVDAIAVNHLIRGYFSTWGVYAAQGYGNIAEALAGNRDAFPNPKVGPQSWLEMIPGIKGFVEQRYIGPSSAAVRDFYNESDRVDLVMKSLRLKADRFDVISSVGLVTENPSLVLYDDMVEARKEMATLAKEVGEIQKSRHFDKYGPEEGPMYRRDAMDKVSLEMTLFADEFMEMYREAIRILEDQKAGVPE